MKPHLYREFDKIQQVLVQAVTRKDQLGLMPRGPDPHIGGLPSRADFEARLEALAMLRLAEHPIDPVAEIERLLTIEPRSGAEAAPLLDIKERFGLDAFEYWVLVLAMAPVLVNSFGRLYSYLRNDFSLPAVGTSLILDLFDWDARPGSACVIEALSPHGRLLRHSLIRVQQGDAPVHQQVWPSNRVIEYVTHGPDIFSAFTGFLEVDRAPAALADISMPLQKLAEIRELAARFAGGDPCRVIGLVGPPGVGKSLVARYLAGELGRPLLRLDAALLPVLAQRLRLGVGDTLAAVLLEARLHHMVPFIRHVDRALDEQAATAEEIGLALKRFGERVLLSVLGPPSLSPALQCDDKLLLPAPDFAARLQLWGQHLPPARRGGDIDLDAIAAHYKISGGRISTATDLAIQRAAALAPPEGRGQTVVTAELLEGAIRETLSHSLHDIADPILFTARWSDLVLSTSTALQLRTIVAHYHNRKKVLYDWGMASQLGKGLSLSAVFTGPPGTGKSMAAVVIARELGLEVYRVDLSRVVDKYIGETEKKLDRAFREAEASGGILLFDEADSLFARRTEVKSSNDRYANLEVNFLLQRLEAFEGIVILTTNKGDALDEAFKRRIGYHVVFTPPDAGEREQLWRRMLAPLGARVPVDEGEFGRLAEEFTFAGGHIRNAVLHAAFLAAEMSLPIGFELLNLSAQIELMQTGSLVKDMDVDALLQELAAYQSQDPT